VNKELRALKILDFQLIRNRLEAWCESAMGSEIALSLQPSFAEQEIWEQLDQTAEAFDLLGTNPPPNINGVHDVRGPLKLASKGAMLGGSEIYQIGYAHSAIRTMREYLEKAQTKKIAFVGLESDPKIEREILFAFESDGSIKDEASPALGELRRKKRTAQARIIERIQAHTSGPNRDLLSDPIYTVRQGRYVIPLKAEYKGRIKGIIHDTSATGSTIFLEPDDVLNAANAARQIETQEREEEKRLLTLFSRKVGNIATITIGALTELGKVDITFAKARLGAEMRAQVPIRISGHHIEVKSGRHPLLDPNSVIPTDIELGGEQSVLITGPNTGGKTVAIKAVGLFVAMMQSGLLPPALHCRFGHFTQLWADIGDEQSIEQSLSTFSAHLKNIASALNNLKPGALILLDEIGAGTDPAEGAALAQSILLEFQSKGGTVLASTHYGELKAFAFSTEGFINASMEFDQKTLRPTYRLILGAAGASQALRIAERYGIQPHVVERAKEGLSTQQRDVAEMLQNLENAQKQARAAQSEADRKLSELKQLEAVAERKLQDAEDIRKRANERAKDAIDSELRNIRIEAEELFEQVKKGKGTVQDAREKIRAIDHKGKHLAKPFQPKKTVESTQVALKKGDHVSVLGFQQNGVLLEDPSGREVLVQMGIAKMKIDIRKLIPTGANPTQATSNKHKLSLNKTMNARTEITLRHKRAEEAIQELERFIDDALLGNVPWVRIVHGKGEGVLRQVTQEFLRKHKDVKSVRDGDATEGGQGVTIATFK
jgi:DNA mismatch repair protein MutS2